MLHRLKQCVDMNESNSTLAHPPPATARVQNVHLPDLTKLAGMPPCSTARTACTKSRLSAAHAYLATARNLGSSGHQRLGFHTPVGPSQRYIWSKGHAHDKPLGSGYTSTVYRGFDQHTGEHVAIKLVPKKKQMLLSSEAYYRRLYGWLPLHAHPNILRLRDFFEDAHHFYIVSDLYTGPDLVDYVLNFAPQSIPSKNIKRVTLQILLGLHHLHSSGLLHRDIKLDNIIFSSESKQNIIIVDFDMSSFHLQPPPPPQHSTRPDDFTIVGTKDYMAPENYHGIYSETSDLWSVGVILYILLDGHFPFDLSMLSNPRQIRQVLKKGAAILPEISRKHPKAADLVSRLLVFDYHDRIQNVKEALMHPWFEPERFLIESILAQSHAQRLIAPSMVSQHPQKPPNLLTADHALTSRMSTGGSLNSTHHASFAAATLALDLHKARCSVPCQSETRATAVAPELKVEGIVRQPAFLTNKQLDELWSEENLKRCGHNKKKQALLHYTIPPKGGTDASPNLNGHALVTYRHRAVSDIENRLP